MGWLLFILDVLLFVGGGLVEKICVPAAVCMFVLGLVVLVLLILGDRRGWF